MNTEWLREVVDRLLDAENKQNIQAKLTQVRDHLQQMIQTPQQPQHQTQFAASLDQARKSFREFLDAFTPPELKSFEEIRASQAFISNVIAEIDESVRQNPMTPQVTLNKINELLSKRDAYLKGLRELQTRLREIGIEPRKLEPGEAEVGILIPRALFQSHLAELITELRALNRIIRAFSEIATGTVEPVEIHQISTSDPVFVFGLSMCTIAFFARVIKWALDTWRQVEEIRKVRAEAQRIPAFTEKDIKDTFDNKIEQAINAAIDAKARELMPPSEKDTGRQNELRTELRWALDSVLARVERGMTVEIRFVPPAGASAGGAAPTETQAVDTLRRIAPQLEFPPAEAAPIRALPSAEPPAP